MLNWITKLLELTSRGIMKIPLYLILFQLLLAVLCSWYTIKHLQFSTDRNALVGADKKYHQIFLKYKQEFPNQDDIVVIVESDNFERNRKFVEILGHRLEQETNLFTDVFYKGDLKMMGKKALLFVDNQTLAELEEELQNYAPYITNFMTATNLVGLFKYINNSFMEIQNKGEESEEAKNMINTLPALSRILRGAYQAAVNPGPPLSPGLAALFGSGEQAESQQYLTFDNGKMYVINLHATDEKLNFQVVSRLRELIEDTKMKIGGINVGITGEPVLEFDEMQQSQHDTTLSTIVSLILCLLIFCYGYREFHRPIAAVFCLMLGLIFTMGWTTLVVGRLNLLTITFLPMLIGLGIDFGVHLVSRFEEELGKGHSPAKSIHISLINTGLGVFTGGLATAGAFLAMGFAKFQGVKEMGIISGGGLIICLLPMMTLLPIILLKGAEWKSKNKKVIYRNPWIREKIDKFWMRTSWPLFILSLLLCLICLIFAFPKIYFDYNLLNMQSKGLPAVVLQDRLLAAATNSVLYGIVMAEDKEEALKLQQELKKLPSVYSVQSAVGLTQNEHLEERLERIGRIREIVSKFQISPPEIHSVDIPKLKEELQRLLGYINFAIEEVKEDPKQRDLLSMLRELANEITEMNICFLREDTNKISRKLGLYQYYFFNDIATTFDTLKTQDNSGPLKPEDLPSPLYNRFVSKNGLYAIEIFPKKDIWERKNQEEFISEIRSICPDVTGSPVQLYEYTSLLKNSYIKAAWYSLAAILILLYLRFRRITYVILALIPVLVGMIWLIGCMVIYGIPFNPANIMALPMTIGVGVSGGIQILNRYLEEGKPVILATSTGMAVIISALTTIAGFGSLMLGKHQGIQSLGFVMGIGTLLCMLASLTTLPSLMTLLTRIGWLKGNTKNTQTKTIPNLSNR